MKEASGISSGLAPQHLISQIDLLDSSLWQLVDD